MKRDSNTLETESEGVAIEKIADTRTQLALSHTHSKDAQTLHLRLAASCWPTQIAWAGRLKGTGRGRAGQGAPQINCEGGDREVRPAQAELDKWQLRMHTTHSCRSVTCCGLFDLVCVIWRRV